MTKPLILVELGRAVELETTTWIWTWNERDNFVVSATEDGKKLAVFKKPTKKNGPEISKKTSGSNLYRAFHGYSWNQTKSGSAAIAQVDGGKAIHIIYQSDKFGDDAKYIHDFELAPNVYVDDLKKPSILELTGGKIRITRRGIEG